MIIMITTIIILIIIIIAIIVIKLLECGPRGGLEVLGAARSASGVYIDNNNTSSSSNNNNTNQATIELGAARSASGAAWRRPAAATRQRACD